ncbi:uncharacterized protein LOC136080866 [Hydra vulgaris]|uniref:Uncharacterized protein LOC136080866 n=1 Tax=Hydra vulgaris TaxID=6087 RepID=A0ABM4BYF8_HYDVU
MHLVILAAMLSIAVAVPTYELICPSGTVLKGRKDFTDQQTEGTNFAGFTCCPTDYPDLHYVNENYFCCPSGTGAYCMSNACNCKSTGLKGGKLPTINKIAR